MFRDSYEALTAGGLAIYGLSADLPRANMTFKDKQKLPYPLLSDVDGTLIGAIGLKKSPKGTTRGVFVVDKTGKVLAASPAVPTAPSLLCASSSRPVRLSPPTTTTTRNEWGRRVGAQFLGPPEEGVGFR